MPRQPEFDAFKGILICLIVLGHNTFFSGHYPTVFASLYNFHVASFLLLPFLFFDNSSRKYEISARVARYLVPHFLFFALACVAFLIMFVDKSAPGIFGWLKSVILAVLFSSEGAYRLACGFGLFWFLPALLTLVLLRAAYLRGNFIRRGAILLSACAVHLALGLAPQGWLVWVPWGLPIALFLFPLGLFLSETWRRGIHSTRNWIVSAAVFAGCTYVGVMWPSSVGLAGDPRVYAIDQPLRLLFHDAYLVVAFLTVLMMCWRIPRTLRTVLAYVGNRSLFVFLVHSFVFQALRLSGALAYLESRSADPLTLILTSYFGTLAITLCLEIAVRGVPRLHCLVFPRSLTIWRDAFAARNFP